MSKKKKLNENSLSSLLGGIVTIKAINSPLAPPTWKSKIEKSSKLTNIVEDIYGKRTSDVNFDVKKFMQTVENYNSFSKIINREGNLRDIANQLSELANSAKSHTLSETEDWFDKVTVTRNMKELGGLSQQFKKTAVEAQSLQERMTGLYEDMGNILGRYYDINEEVREEGKYRTGDELEDDSVKEGTYQNFFISALKRFGVSSPEELDDDKKVKFYDYVDKNWTAKKETD